MKPTNKTEKKLSNKLILIIQSTRILFLPQQQISVKNESKKIRDNKPKDSRISTKCSSFPIHQSFTSI